MSTKKGKHRNTLFLPATSCDKQDSKGVAGSVRINEEQQVKQLNNQQKIEEPNTPIFCITPKEKFSSNTVVRDLNAETKSIEESSRYPLVRLTPVNSILGIGILIVLTVIIIGTFVFMLAFAPKLISGQISIINNSHQLLMTACQKQNSVPIEFEYCLERVTGHTIDRYNAQWSALIPGFIVAILGLLVSSLVGLYKKSE